MKRLLLLALALSFLGAMCPSPKPAKYGAELAICLETSKSWAEYEPCCLDVAQRYHRDPSFCLRDADVKDAGAQ
jgi:hypothetical protein